MTKDKMTFEEALAGLEKSASELRREDISLEEAMEIFEKGTALYRTCSDILNDAKQKIEFFTKEQDYE